MLFLPLPPSLPAVVLLKAGEDVPEGREGQELPRQSLPVVQLQRDDDRRLGARPSRADELQLRQVRYGGELNR